MKRDEMGRVKMVTFSVRNIDCATCAFAIEKQVKKIEGVKSVGTALMLNKVFIDYDESKVALSEITKAIDKSGYSSHIIRKEEKQR